MRNTEENIKNIKEFNKELKGNGEIGIFEEIRSIKRQITRIKIIILAIVIIGLGGSYFGITGEKIKEKFGIGKKIETKNVEEDINNKIIKEK